MQQQQVALYTLRKHTFPSSTWRAHIRLLTAWKAGALCGSAYPTHSFSALSPYSSLSLQLWWAAIRLYLRGAFFSYGKSRPRCMLLTNIFYGLELRASERTRQCDDDLIPTLCAWESWPLPSVWSALVCAERKCGRMRGKFACCGDYIFPAKVKNCWINRRKFELSFALLRKILYGASEMLLRAGVEKRDTWVLAFREIYWKKFLWFQCRGSIEILAWLQ